MTRSIPVQSIDELALPKPLTVEPIVMQPVLANSWPQDAVIVSRDRRPDREILGWAVGWQVSEAGVRVIRAHYDQFEGRSFEFAWTCDTGEPVRVFYDRPLEIQWQGAFAQVRTDFAPALF